MTGASLLYRACQRVVGRRIKNPHLGLRKVRCGFRWVCSHAEDEMGAIFEAIFLRRLSSVVVLKLKHHLKGLFIANP